MEADATNGDIAPMSPTAITIVHAAAVQANRVDRRRRAF
jgi:hypothetical protein